ncbi:MAG: hypothetical protein KatS3mg022_2954 [Armatimonadota bacterium]|nr:MAG: hypothetical protein KatS3mg022_2954 [Armatimonadota bacterium]
MRRLCLPFLWGRPRHILDVTNYTTEGDVLSSYAGGCSRIVEKLVVAQGERRSCYPCLTSPPSPLLRGEGRSPFPCREGGKGVRLSIHSTSNFEHPPRWLRVFKKSVPMKRRYLPQSRLTTLSVKVIFTIVQRFCQLHPLPPRRARPYKYPEALILTLLLLGVSYRRLLFALAPELLPDQPLPVAASCRRTPAPTAHLACPAGHRVRDADP